MSFLLTSTISPVGARRARRAAGGARLVGEISKTRATATATANSFI